MQECCYISDNLHTSYVDILDLAASDRAGLIEYINAKQDATKKAVDQMVAENKAKQKK